MSIRKPQETETETVTDAEYMDSETNHSTMLLFQEQAQDYNQNITTSVAKDELRIHHLHSINSTVVIRQLPSQGLSFQLWPAAATLVSLLDHRHCSTAFSALLNHSHLHPLRILELGSGTGLVGIAAAAILGAHVTVTDLPHVIPNLKFNAEANAEVVRVNGGKVEVAALGWGEEETGAIKEKEYDMIMGSDVVYHDHLYEPLLQTLRFFLLGDEMKTKNELVFVMAHLKRWKKESAFFKIAKKDFDVEIIHRDNPCNGSRVGVLVYTFVRKKKKKKKVEVTDNNKLTSQIFIHNGH